MRQPATIGVALTIFIAGAAPAMLSAKTNFEVSSMPIRPEAMPRSLRPVATRSNGLSSSCQIATSVCSTGPPASCSRVRSSSNAGVTMYGLPTFGMTTAVSRSLLPQRMPVK